MVAVRSYWLALASLPLVMLGGLAPWVTHLGVRVDGSQDEVVLILGLVATAIVLYMCASDRRWIAAGPLVIGLTLAALTANDIRDPADVAHGIAGHSLHLQWGIYLAFLGSATLALASALLVVGPRLKVKMPTSIRPRSLLLGTWASELVDRMTPTGALDYAPHRIELVLGSQKVLGRLSSVEKEPFTVEWIETLESGDVLYDLGANVGAYSLIAAKATGHQAQVFAFEPSPATYRDLFRNVLHNGCAECITALPLALWSESKVLSFRFHLFRSGAAKHRVATELDSGSPRVSRVIGVRLDDLVERFGLPVPTHAKIDVDGGELEVLRGAVRTLRRPEWRSILIELELGGETEQNREIKALLAEAGFRPTQRHSRGSTPNDRKDRYWTFTKS